MEQPDMGLDSPEQDPGELSNAFDDVGAMNWVMGFGGFVLFVLMDFQAHKKQDGIALKDYLSEYYVTLLIAGIGTPLAMFAFAAYMELNYLSSLGTGLASTWIIKKIQEMFMSKVPGG